MAMRRVVVTGLGAVSPLGVGVRQNWNNLLDGKSAIISLKGRGNGRGEFAGEFDALPATVAAVVPSEFDSIPLAIENKSHNIPTFISYALVAAAEALNDAKWIPEKTDHKLLEATGVAIGSGIGNIDEIVRTGITFANKGYRHVSPFFVPKILVNMAAGHVSIEYGFKGPNHAVSTACTTGLHAIGDALRFIQHGDADLMVAGGTEACISPLAMAGFCRSRALATAFNDKPSESSRPFDKHRNGFVIAEGAAIVVLEELEHAKRRGVKIYAELAGYGLTGDAHHITAPSNEGSGAYRAMQRALDTAGLKPEDLDYVNAHATSTPLGDVIELQAIDRLFNGHEIHVSSTKGATGHLLGAAGALEALFTIMSVNQSKIPPTCNLIQLDAPTSLRVRVVGPQTLTYPVRAALTNSFGFGGTNGSLCIKAVELPAK